MHFHKLLLYLHNVQLFEVNVLKFGTVNNVLIRFYTGNSFPRLGNVSGKNHKEKFFEFKGWPIEASIYLPCMSWVFKT